MMLYDMTEIPGLYSKPFIMMWELKKGFQLFSEGENLILKKKTTKIRFYEKTVDTGSEGFILTKNI